MTDAREAAARAAAAHWLARICKDGLALAKEDLKEHLEPGERIRATIDGLQVGTISMSDPKTVEKIEVTDPAAFTKWVAKHEPTAIVPTVADWYADERNLAAVIEKTGEVPDGVEIREVTRNPTLSVRISDKQEENLLTLTTNTNPIAMIEGD